ncbi:MAG: hypothetical protein WBV51_14265, partial [Pseudolabrys sp.]
QDNNAIAAAQRINWLILDIALNVFSKLLLKMIKEVLLRAADCWSNQRLPEKYQWYYYTNREPYP